MKAQLNHEWTRMNMNFDLFDLFSCEEGMKG